MIEIKDLLLRFNGFLLSEEIKKEYIQSVISDIVNIQIKKEDIKIKNGTLFLNIKPIYKSEIFMKRDQIFFELEKKLGKKAPKNIR
ncbi:MAG TPA: hypothetical protein PKZ36_01165 [Candidatus Paceibacterota bacterium]|nr:hypothetical protein [Candidatus Paceibacterota bacterium]HPT17999.1 hypothetical protein [Candidatus Paceibacterota bacterium]